MKLRNLLGPALAAVLFLAAAPVLQAKELVKVPMGWMNENETFAAWLAEARREKSPPGGVITRAWPRCMERNKIAKAGPKPRLLLSP